jgi:hypothetical protein
MTPAAIAFGLGLAVGFVLGRRRRRIRAGSLPTWAPGWALGVSENQQELRALRAANRERAR